MSMYKRSASYLPVVIAVMDEALQTLLQKRLSESGFEYTLVNPLHLLREQRPFEGGRFILLEVGQDVALLMQIVLQMRRQEGYNDVIVCYVQKNVYVVNPTLCFWMIEGRPAIDIHLSLEDTLNYTDAADNIISALRYFRGRRSSL